MLSTIRRFGVPSALRASAPRSISARYVAQLPKWQAPSTLASVSAIRSLHSSSPLFSADAAQAYAEQTEARRITEFAELASEGIVSQSIIKNIVQPDRMNIKTMTDVQSLTLNEIVKGQDM